MLSSIIERNSNLRDKPHSRAYLLLTALGFGAMFAVVIIGMLAMLS